MTTNQQVKSTNTSWIKTRKPQKVIHHCITRISGFTIQSTLYMYWNYKNIYYLSTSLVKLKLLSHKIIFPIFIREENMIKTINDFLLILMVFCTIIFFKYIMKNRLIQKIIETVSRILLIIKRYIKNWRCSNIIMENSVYVVLCRYVSHYVP